MLAARAKRAIRNPTFWFFIWVLSMGILWSFAQPLYGSPDETAHVVKAVATADLQFGGRTTIGDFGFESKVFEVPQAYSQGLPYIACILGEDRPSAACLGPFQQGSNKVEVASSAAHYPPTYYALVGPIGLMFPGSGGFYAMRLVSSLLTAIVGAWAFRLALMYGSKTRAVGVVIAFSPMAFSLSGAVNPHGLEIAGAILFWVGCLTALEKLRDNQAISRRLIGTVLVSTFLFATVRPAAFFWMIPVVALMILFSGPRSSVRSLIRKYQGRILSVIVSSGVLLSMVLYKVSGIGTAVGGGTEPGLPTYAQNLEAAFDRGDEYFRFMFGWFGWVEFAAPPLAFFLCIGAIALAIGFSSLVAGSKKTLMVILCLAAVIFLPIISEGIKAKTSGFGYQGRYTLALAVGLPILAMWVRGNRLNRSDTRTFSVLAIATSALASILCLNFALQRYTVGLNGRKFWMLSPDWLPPGGLPLIALLAVAIGTSLLAFTYLLVRLPD